MSTLYRADLRAAGYDTFVASIDERGLRKKIARVEALHRGATTPGEREAAARAKARLVDRLGHVRQSDPIAQFCAEHIIDLGVAPEPPPPPEQMPTEEEIAAVLLFWEEGDWDEEEVCAWAGRLVDRVFLPADADEADAPLAEVLLQLSDLEHVRLMPSDIPRIRRFLRRRDWGAWFDLVAEAAAR